jgi:hypothetical protein
MVVDFIKIEPGMSTTKPSNKKVVSTVRPTPLNKPIQSMANQQQQQIIVIPGNMLIGNKQNGQAATMEQVKSILKLATTSNQNLQTKTIVTTSNPKTTITGSNVTSKAPVVLPTLMKSTTNAAIVRPVSNRTAIVSPQQLQSSPRVISLKRPYSAITCAKPEIAEPNIIKISPSSHIQGISTITTDHIKKEVDDDTSLQSDQPVRKRANLDHIDTEEKMMRRKLKNRVAAQNARDKKRVKMDEMEDKIKRLEEENKLLMEKQQGLINLSQRLMKENEILSGKPSQEIEPTSFIKVEPQVFEDTDISQNHVLYVPPLSPESLPRSPSPSSSISSSTMTQHQRLSSLDSDGELTDSQSSIVSSDLSDVSSLVEQRSVEPAEPINVLQQKEPDRRLAGEEIMCKSQKDSLLDPSTTALFMTCLMTTILPVVNNLASQDKETAPMTSSREHSEHLDSSTLPPKKRMSQQALHHPLEERRLPT